THHLAPGDDERARRRFALADRLGLRAVAHQALRYLDPADARVADVMDAVRRQVPLGPGTSTRRNAEGYLKTPQEMARVFAERPDALANTVWVAERCVATVGLREPDGPIHVPDFVARGADAAAELRARCLAGVNERYANPGPRHWDLLERELAMVAQLGLAPYFLTVAEIVERIREKQIMAACRGSAAGSLVCYALRISDVDPIAHDLVFERFMNPYRDELPDIDIDVESARREDVYRDLLDRYGDDRVACVAMVETFKARMAIREVGKAMGLPANEIDYVAKSFPHVRARDVRPALEHLPELSGLRLDAGQLGLLFDVVERLDGFPRHIALHPSGVLLADRTLRDMVPLERSANGFAMAQFDKDDVEALGLCKLDVLGVRMLSSMAHCRDEVRRTRGIELDFSTVPWDDEATYQLIRSTRTLGMFQIESPGQRELVGKFQPEHLSDLVVDISLFRPGPVKGDMVGPFLARRLGHKPVVYPHPLLERALGETYGVIVYHEQVMRCVAAVTGCDLATADLVRRRLGDPTEVDDLREWILAGARERGMSPEVAESLWQALVQFASFGFCKAHAAAFAVPTYRSAWLKAHFLPEFVAGLLTHDPGMYPRRLLLDDARQFGVAALPLDVNRSDRVYRVEAVPADEAYALLGVDPAPGGRLPRGWSRDEEGRPVPPAGWDLGVCHLNAPAGRSGDTPPGSASPAGTPPAGTPPAEVPQRWGIRLALQDVAGIDDRMIDSLLAERPFTSVADLRRRSALSAPVAEALTRAGALDEIGGVGLPGGPTRRDLLLEVSERWSGLSRHRPADPTAPEQLRLLPSEGPAGLAEYRPSEKVRAELEVLGLDASQHVMRFYDDLLDVLGVTRAMDLLGCANGQRVRIAGVKVATQTPPVKSGQRIIFLSLDDATGVSDATFFESVHDRCAWTVFHTWLLVVEGTVHRTGRRGVSLNAERVWDLRRLMRAWRGGWLDTALAEQGRIPALAHRDHDDQSPRGTQGAPGRSGLRLPSAEDGGQVNGKPLAELRRAGAVTPAARIWAPRNAPYGAPAAALLDHEPGRPSRVAPNGTTWADPAGRHGGIAHQDAKRLSRNDPRHPDHPAQRAERERLDEPPRKLWHASGGSAGR
ncbi:MAG TPA: DNA polymerase III subunit alpha, partial [Egibacteraceae bacterium]